MTVGVRNK